MNFHTLLDKLFKEEMNSIKIEQVTDQRGSNKGVKRSNVIGSKNGSIEIILNLFKGHYFIEERTKVCYAISVQGGDNGVELFVIHV